MILQALNTYYETLVAEGTLSAPGWDKTFKVSYGLELDDEGRIRRLIYLKNEQMRGKKTVLLPQTMRVPAHAGRSSGISANFLCDNSAYLLGVAEIKNDEKDPKKKNERNRECFYACAALHKKILNGISTPAAKAILAYFENWKPEQAEQDSVLTSDSAQWKEVISGANLIFFYDGQNVTEDTAVCEAWQNYYNTKDENAVTAQCLITGKNAPIAQTHPLIKGVRGAQSSGASLVSFNAPAFESYGHTQGENAPVSVQAAFGYGAALNYLLSGDNSRMIGDTTVVCWAEHGQPQYQEFSLDVLFGSNDSIQKNVDNNDLRGALSALARGDRCDWDGLTLLPDEHFYFLGLAPNAARLSVRFFLRDTFGSFARSIQRHYDDIAVIRPSFDMSEDLPLWRLLGATVNQKSRTKTPSPQMSGAVLQAILSGTPYPTTLLNGATLRIRAERQVTRVQAAIIKGYYTRANNPYFPKEALTMELNPNCTNVPYTLGRLFAVYEKIQQDANPNLNTTIKDRYFNSACATPAYIFPAICKLSQSHQKVLERNSKGNFVEKNKLLIKLSSLIGMEYPTRLTLPEQGAFQLGYYHQMQEFFTKKETKQEDK